MCRYLIFDDDLRRQKRLLVANAEASTEERQLNSESYLNGKPEVINDVQDLFSRMKAVPTITVDLHPVQIPMFCCTRFWLLDPNLFFVLRMMALFIFTTLPELELLRSLNLTRCLLMLWKWNQACKISVVFRNYRSNRVAFRLGSCGDTSWHYQRSCSFRATCTI